MRSQRGFTLLEVIVAFLVFSLVFATVLQGLTGSLRNARRAAMYTEAALWAASKMDEIGTTIPLQDDTRDGEFDDRFHFHLEIQSVAEDNPAGISDISFPVTLYHAALTVRWKDGKTDKQARFTTLRAVNRG